MAAEGVPVPPRAQSDAALPHDLGAVVDDVKEPAGKYRKLTHGRVTLDEANGFVAAHHRHHPPVIGHLFSIGAFRGEQLAGVVIVGRPVSRMRDDGLTAEVTRLCTDGTQNVCSFLYGRAARAAFALGFRRIGTYTLPDEGGASLRASGWKLLGERGGGEWDSPSRPRASMKSPTGIKHLWEAAP